MYNDDEPTKMWIEISIAYDDFDRSRMSQYEQSQLILTKQWKRFSCSHDSVLLDSIKRLPAL
jgi:hypothetical protein